MSLTSSSSIGDHIEAISRPEASAVSVAGLTNAKARRRLTEVGPNTVGEQAPLPWRTFVAKFWGPIPWMLEAAIVLQVGRAAYFEAAAIRR